MKSAVCLVLFAWATVLGAQDYYWVDTNKVLALPANVVSIDLRDRLGDRKDYRDAGMGIPSALPAIVDAQCGDILCRPGGTIEQAMIALRRSQKDGVTNEFGRLFDAFTFSTNTMAVIGTNRTGFGLLRFDGTKLSAAQREQYQTECIQYLAARLQVIERELKRKRVVNVKTLVEEATTE